MSTSLNLGMPYLTAAQSQKEVTHNEALAILDAVVHLAVEDRDATQPPSTVAEGQVYLIATTGSSGWLGYGSGQLAYYLNAAWSFITPKEGWKAWVKDEDALLCYEGTAVGWRNLNPRVTVSKLSSNEYAGTVDVLTLGTAVAFAQGVFIDSSAQIQISNAGSSSTMPVIGLCVSSGSSGTERGILTDGWLRNDAWNFTKGAALYASTMAGGLSTSYTTAAGGCRQAVAVAYTSNVIRVRPSLHFEVAT
jgi:hypothetical protein